MVATFGPGLVLGVSLLCLVAFAPEALGQDTARDYLVPAASNLALTRVRPLAAAPRVAADGDTVEYMGTPLGK